MAKIGDEIRQFVQRSYEDEHMDPKELLAIADRIDAELVELPKDADGVPIRAGDTLDGYGKTIEVVEMRYGRGGWVLISRDGSGYADTFAFAHHHEPTVEDVLFEFAQFWSDEELTDIEHLQPDAAQTLAEYAAKVILTNHGFGEPHIFTHSSPDSWERIADELDEQAGSLTKDGYTWQEDAIHDLAGRIRKLAKEQGDE